MSCLVNTYPESLQQKATLILVCRFREVIAGDLFLRGLLKISLDTTGFKESIYDMGQTWTDGTQYILRKRFWQNINRTSGGFHVAHMINEVLHSN